MRSRKTSYIELIPKAMLLPNGLWGPVSRKSLLKSSAALLVHYIWIFRFGNNPPERALSPYVFLTFGDTKTQNFLARLSNKVYWSLIASFLNIRASSGRKYGNKDIDTSSCSLLQQEYTQWSANLEIPCSIFSMEEVCELHRWQDRRAVNRCVVQRGKVDNYFHLATMYLFFCASTSR